jgi:flagellar motor switch protein FliG
MADATARAPDGKGSDARSGAERAAILLLTLGEKGAAEVLKHMPARDVQLLGSAMAQVANVSRSEVSEVLALFSTEAESQTSLGVDSADYVRKTLIGALGEDKAAGLIDRILVGRSSKGLEAMKWMDARAIIEMIRLEHPQIIALILAYLDSEQAAAVLAGLPENTRSDLLLRVATLDGIQPSAMEELDQIMERQFAGNTQGRNAAMGGPQAVANIVNRLEPRIESAVMEEITKADEALGAKIQDLIFVFDDLMSIDDRGMQELLRQVPSDRLLLAMKAADDELKAKIFKNMSQRAAEMLKDDLESKGPVKLSEVEAAQKEILAVARKLGEEGSLNLGGKGGDAYV